MITLWPVMALDANPTTWADDVNRRVIAKDGDEWWARDMHGSLGPHLTLSDAMVAARHWWGDAVALGPALDLERDLRDARGEDGIRYLVEYLASYGPDGVEDLQALAHEALLRAGEE